MKEAKTTRKTGKTARCITGQKTPLLAAFLADVQAFCAARHGRVSELAAAAGVAQPHVSAWLHGKMEPGGEATLTIQAWLAAERAAEAREHSPRPSDPPRLAAALLAAKRASSPSK